MILIENSKSDSQLTPNMAYYVVYLNLKQKNVIVPATWIKDIEQHYEKFVNNSLNRSQIFLCFYPDESSQSFIDGRPDENFEPDFQSENCFTGKLKRYFGEQIEKLNTFF